MAYQSISTVIVAAASYDLTDIATVKEELSISPTDRTKDAFLARAISQVSLAISNYCNRVFQLETVQDLIFPDRDAYPWMVPGGVAPLQLSRWPLISPPFALSTSTETVSGRVLPFTSTAGVAVGQPVAGDGIPAGVVVSSLVTDTSVTLSAAIADAIPSGGTVTFGLGCMISDAPGGVTKLVAGTGYQIDAARGWLVRLNPYTSYPTTWDAVQTTVVYQAGFATIPADVVDATLRMVTGRYTARGRDPLLKSQSQPNIGEQSYWIGTLPSMRGGMTEEVADLLDNYRVPVVT